MQAPEFKLDEYARQLQIQNAGGVCEHCHSAVGHFNVCPVLNGTAVQSVRDGIHAAALESRRYRLEQPNAFYRPPQFSNIEQVKAVVKMSVPELVLSAEDERFLHDINEAFNS